ncbi:histidine kinase N-terminal 7TM domain-containing protein [Paenibacillus sp. HB172176]|uniref:histidine kinase N-terminal 7TM domain-containing diguanylate cyclase n=1 Tax=Paenibacillus sp. HB172176 TaxID=2493690 RepID=UPI001438E696|nr:histidine kinase N-terminal 7TM domain-containing protein [Paenibacillus sp. HB172176]
MQTNLTAYLSLLATSGVVNIFLCLYAYYRRREFPESRILVLLTAVQSVYIFAFALELASSSLDEIKRWTVVEYIGIAFAPVFGLKLVLRYIGRSVSSFLSRAMFLIPCITVVLVATNDHHHLFYKSVYLRDDSNTPLADVVIGQWYIVHGAYTFGCLLASAILLLTQWNGTRREYRVQLFTLFIGQCLPMIGAFVYLMGATPKGMDPVPFLLCITSALYLWAIRSTHMLIVAPIAKDSIFESMREGVIVLDSTQKLIDYNRAAKAMLPTLRKTLFGREIGGVWKELTGSAIPDLLLTEDSPVEIYYGHGMKKSVYQLRLSKVRGRRGEHAGDLLMFIDVTEQKRLQEQLTRMAYYDGLTGILNRAQFIIRCKAMLEKSKYNPKNSTIAAALFDIDHFKQFNDTYGHETGDAVLLHAVKLCQSILEESMLFARYGGEEFIIALETATLSEAAKLAERIRCTLASNPFQSPLNGPLTVTASFGVAAASSEGETLESLLRHADAALYEAKRSGRNQVKLYAHTSIHSWNPPPSP